MTLKTQTGIDSTFCNDMGTCQAAIELRSDGRSMFTDNASSSRRAIHKNNEPPEPHQIPNQNRLEFFNE